MILLFGTFCPFATVTNSVCVPSRTTTKMSDTDSFDQILNRLNHLDRDKAEDLNKLKKLVLSSTSEEIVAILDARDLQQLNGVFRKLFKSNEKYIYEDLTDILNHILERLGSEQFYERFEALIRGEVLPSSDCPKLKSIYLKLLLVCCKEMKVQNSIIDRLLSLIIESVGDSDEEVGKRAVDILQYLSTKVDGFLDDQLFAGTNLSLQSIKNRNEIVKFRYFEFLITLVLAKETFLQNRNIQAAIKELLELGERPDDPLLVRNCLIILDKLIESDAGVEYLDRFGYFDLVASKITNPQSDLFANLLMPGYLETFAKLGSTSPDLLQNHQNVIDQIVDFILAGDFASCCIESIGLVGRLGKGKLVLNSNAKFIEQCLPKLGQLLQHGQTQVEVLNCLASLFDLNDLDATVEISNLLEVWYSKLTTDRKQTRETIFGLCKQAFPEIHLNSLNLIHKLAKHLWGQKELAQLTGFLDYVLNRATEVDYKSKQAKFKLITELATSPFTKAAFGPMEHAKIRKVYQDGAFHVESDVTVAVEGGV